MWKVLCLLGVLTCSAVNAAIWNITYPRPLTDFDPRNRFPLMLLTLALDQTGVKYKLLPSERILLQGKALSQLAENREVNVVWAVSDKQREQELLPIRIPVYKGLIGWRVFLIHENKLERFKHLDNLEQLRDYTMVQGSDWPDTKILQANGFTVKTSDEYTELFTFLLTSQGDLFPRSVVEALSEVELDDIDEAVVLEPFLGVRYPTAMYFFVNKKDIILANLLEKGLEKAIANGKFDELFKRELKDTLDRTELVNRKFFQLDNPLLPNGTPIDRPELWYQVPADVQK